MIPSKWEEPFGLIALEGIASHIRIISSSSGGLPEVLGNICLYVNKNHLIDELVSQMRKVLLENCNIDERDYNKIIKKFSKENYTNTFNNYLIR